MGKPAHDTAMFGTEYIDSLGDGIVQSCLSAV